MRINNAGFQEVLEMATIQADPQRLLFVFTRSELPEQSSEAELQSFKYCLGSYR